MLSKLEYQNTSSLQAVKFHKNTVLQHIFYQKNKETGANTNPQGHSWPHGPPQLTPSTKNISLQCF